MISLCQEFAFVHVNKTGGTSVHEALAHWEDATTADIDHAPAHQLRDMIGPELWAEFFTFAFVRNPYDRLVSAYEYRRQWLEDGRVATPAKERSFHDWIVEIVEPGPRNTEYTAQAGMLADPATGEILVDRVCFYERLREEWEEIRGTLRNRPGSLSIELPGLGHRNKTQRRHWREYHDEATAAFVEDRFAADFDLAEALAPGLWDRWTPSTR